MIYFPPAVDPAVMEQVVTADRLQRWNGPAGEFIGWKRPSPTQPAVGQVLVLHGNAGCAFQCGRYADVIQQAGAFDVFMVEYPGYAGRPGKPSEHALERSATEAFEALDLNRPTYLAGESLGTGVACFLAGNWSNRVAGVVLLAPYNSLVDVAKEHTRILPVRLLLRDRFPAEDFLRTYRGPVAMLVAGGDTVVPAKFGKRLYDGYAGPKRLWEFPGGNHGTVMEQPVAVWDEILTFLQSNHLEPLF